MKRSSKFLIAIVLVLLCSSMVFAEARLPKDRERAVIPVFIPPATDPVVTIAGAGDVDVSGYKVVMFQDDVTIYWGSDSSNTYLWVANMPLGIAEEATTIHVDAATQMVVMEK